jgi:hypothetical protein
MFRMTVPMQPFIAETMRLITEALRAPHDRALAEASEPLSADHILDGSMAEAVNDGSLIFPNPEGDSEPDWCVLSHSNVGRSNELQAYRFCRRLRADMKPEEFVEKAYEVILGRRIDAEGRRIYPPQLEKNVLTKRKVLKILLQSQEARNLKARFLVVPEPSSWLSNLRVAAGDDSSFPALTVKLPQQPFP